jgi:hypothetical protein
MLIPHEDQAYDDAPQLLAAALAPLKSNPQIMSHDAAGVWQPAELAEAARLGLTAQDLEQLIEDLAQKEFAQLEWMMDRIDKQGGSMQDAVDQWARSQVLARTQLISYLYAVLPGTDERGVWHGSRRNGSRTLSVELRR